MNSSDQNPKLPLWIFIVTDLALIGAAAVIALRSAHPLSGSAILWIVACVALGAIVGLVPLVAAYERQKNEALDERQRALEALTRTVSASAEQISIAATGLHELAELAQKNLRLAEHLPHKLQDKIAEFQAQLATATDAEKEELERELLALRTTESERLEAVSQRIAKSTAEWAKLETATHQHLAAANDAAAKLALNTAAALASAQTAAEQAMTPVRLAAARALDEARGNATHAIESAGRSALAELDAKLAAATTTIVARVTSELGTKLAPAEPAANVVAAHTPVAPADTATRPSSTESTPPTGSPEKLPDATPTPPKRPRKPRPDESLSSSDPAAVSSAGAPTVPPADLNPPAATNNAPTSVPVSDEPPPAPPENFSEVAPVAPTTTEPFSRHIANGTPPLPSEISNQAALPPELAKPARKRPARNTEPDEPGLALDFDDMSGHVSHPIGERVLTSDGATRLLVTAYIGIGNRLFIRGEGPGLNWEKGVPLQFVSIGKWRWETNDASAPIQFKLYKNDDLECPALGTQSLDPGHQQEVTAAF